MNDGDIREHIETLVAEEHSLLEHGENGKLTGDDRNASTPSRCSSIDTGIYYGSAAPAKSSVKIPASQTCAAKRSSNTTVNKSGVILSGVEG